MTNRISLTEGTLQNSTELRSELLNTLDVLYTRTRGLPRDCEDGPEGSPQPNGPSEEEKSIESAPPSQPSTRPPSYRRRSEGSLRPDPADGPGERERRRGWRTSVFGEKLGGEKAPEEEHSDDWAQQYRFDAPVSDVGHTRIRGNFRADPWAGESRCSGQPEDPNAYKYPKGVRFVLMMIAVNLAISVVALDSTIVSTATPTLVSLWKSLSDIGWYGSAYLLPLPTLQPLFGKVYPHGNTKWLFLSGLAIFEGGSLTCALANSSLMFIMGRMTAGIGAALLAPGIMLIITDTVPKQKRPLMTGITALAAGAAACLGPTLGGIFTTQLTWRWCFYINIPLGGAIGIVLAFLYKPHSRKPQYQTRKEVFLSLDIPGCVILICGIVALLLGVTFGAEYGWSDVRVIALLAGFGGAMLLLVLQQWNVKPQNAMLPKTILKKKGIIICSIFGFLAEVGSTSHIYYLPIYFQGAKNVTAEQSGIDVLPYLIAQTIAGIVTGVIVHLTSFFNPTMLLGSAMFAGGAGAFLTLSPSTSTAAEIGFQVLAACGAGASQFMAMGIAQQLLDREEESIGLSMVYMIKMLGSAIAVAGCSSVFNSELKVNLTSYGLPPGVVLDIMTNFMSQTGSIAAHLQGDVARGVSAALNTVFIIPLAAGCVAFVAALCHDWHKVAKPAAATTAA